MSIQIFNPKDGEHFILFAEKLFYFYDRDTMQDMLDRFTAQYPQLASDLIKEMNEAKQAMYNENGVSLLGYTKLAMVIPEPIYYAMKALYGQDFWSKNDRKNFRLFAALAPKLSIGRV